MTGTEADAIIKNARSQGLDIEFAENDCAEVDLCGLFSIEELQAILHKMEYTD